MGNLTEIARNFIAALQQASPAGIISHLCGLRNTGDKLQSQVPPRENELAMITTPYQLGGRLEYHGLCKSCEQRLKPTGPVVFVLGAPGAGKGTHCAFLTREFGFHHLSYGDLCRRLKSDQDSFVSRLATKPGSNNPVVPDDLGAWLMWKEILTDPGRHWLVDGFPKRVEHLEEFLNLMPRPSLTLVFECPQDISLQRVAKRGKIAGKQARPEDLDEGVSRKRIEDFHRNMARVLDALEDKNMNLVVVDTNRAEDLIQDELRQIMSENSLAR